MSGWEGGKAWDENESRERRLRVRRGEILNEKEYLVKERQSAAGYQTKQVNKNTIGMTLTRDD